MTALTFTEIADHLKAKLGDNVLAVAAEGFTPYVQVEAYAAAAAARVLKEDPQLSFDFLLCETAVDYPAENKITLVYIFFSYAHRHQIVLKADVARAGGRAPTLVPVYAGAEWCEREIYDLFGVTFDGHPNLRRILMPDDYTGYPLLKDFQSPDYVPMPEPKIG